MTECPDDATCKADRGPYGMTYAHAHCAIDGCVMMAIGGGGDDGRGIDGYEDANGNGAIPCADCGDLMAQGCLKPSNQHGYKDGKYWCDYCEHQASLKAHDEALHVLGLQDAITDVKESLRRVSSECDPVKVAEVRPLLAELRQLVADYEGVIAVSVARSLIPKSAA